MSQSRSDSGSGNSQQTIIQRLSESPLFKPLVQTAVTIPAVVLSTFPLELMGNLKRSGHPNAYSLRFVASYMLANRWTLLVGVAAAHKQSAVKNGILAHREGVHGTIKQKSANEEDINIHGEIELPVGKRVGVTALTTTIIATADLLATNYWANLRLASQFNVLPVFNGMSDKFRFMWVTAGARYMTLTVGAAGVIGGSLLLKDPLERQFPVSQYGYFGALLSGVIPGMIAGPLGNMWDVIRVNQMRELDVARMKVPSMWSVAKNLYKTNGYSVFMRGSVVNALYAVTVYSTIAVVDQWVNNSLFAGRKSPDAVRRMSKESDRIESVQPMRIADEGQDQRSQEFRR